LPSAGKSEGKGSRLSVRPTARGWQAIVIGVLVVVVARLIGTTQLHQLGYVLLVLPVAALLLGLATSRGLSFSRRLPANGRITAGSEAGIELHLDNSSRFGTSVVEVYDRLPDERDFEFSPLGGESGSSAEVPVTFPRRGVYHLGPAETAVVDPFDLVRFTRKFEERTEVVVYPEVHELRGFPVRGGNSDSGGRGTIGHRGDEFAGLREYRRGDDKRHIHWKSVARTGELYVKEFSLHAPKRHTVALDLRRGGLRALDGPVEDAVSTAASVLTHLRAEGLPFRLMCNDEGKQATSFGTDEASYWRAMRILASVRSDGKEELADSVLDDRGKNGSSLGEGVVLVTRHLDEDLPDCVRKLRSAGLSVVAALVASYTYRPSDGASARASEREHAFLRHAERLDRAGASVCVVRHPEGVSGLSGTEMRGAV
jgi:uncharacterized protein (DUF58 family)